MTDGYLLTFCVDARIVYFYQGFAVIMSGVTGYVWWKTHRDPACLRNSLWVRRIRSWALIATSSSLCVSAVYFSIEILLLVLLFGSTNMAVNAYALRQRNTPPHDRRPVHVLGGRRIAFRPLMLVGELLRRDKGR